MKIDLKQYTQHSSCLGYLGNTTTYVIDLKGNCEYNSYNCNSNDLCYFNTDDLIYNTYFKKYFPEEYKKDTHNKKLIHNQKNYTKLKMSDFFNIEYIGVDEALNYGIINKLEYLEQMMLKSWQQVNFIQTNGDWFKYANPPRDENKELKYALIDYYKHKFKLKETDIGRYNGVFHCIKMLISLDRMHAHKLIS